MDWWHHYNQVGWGEARADLRQLATLGVGEGVRGFEMEPPYWNPETPEDVRAEFDEIERQWQEQYGDEHNRGHNSHRA
jgi:hypothetical protein